MELEKNDNALEGLRKVFATKILPLLEEYFYGDPAKIGMILGERFVRKKNETIQLAKFDKGEVDFEERSLYALRDPSILTDEDFRTIYE